MKRAEIVRLIVSQFSNEFRGVSTGDNPDSLYWLLQPDFAPLEPIFVNAKITSKISEWAMQYNLCLEDYGTVTALLKDTGVFEEAISFGWDSWSDEILLIRPAEEKDSAYLLLGSGEMERAPVLLGRWSPWGDSAALREFLVSLVACEPFAEQFYSGVPTDVSISRAVPLQESDAMAIVRSMANYRQLNFKESDTEITTS
jgi:hypothetical protein